MDQGQLRIKLGTLPLVGDVCIGQLIDEGLQVCVGLQDDDSSLCIPWDAVVAVTTHDEIGLVGSVGPSGLGQVTVTIPRDKADSVYCLGIDIFNRDDYDLATGILKAYGVSWEEASAD